MNEIFVNAGDSASEARRYAQQAQAAFDGLEADDHTFTGVQTFTPDIYIGAARMGREGNNLKFGYVTIPDTATGETNLALGDDTLSALTSGDRNVAVGSNCGQAITSGSFNFLALYAGLSLTTGSFNFIGGADAGASATTLSYAVIIGTNAAEDAVSGNGPVAIGESALRRKTAYGGDADVAIGKGASASLTIGTATTVGHNAAGATTTGQGIVAIGAEALVANIVGNYLTAAGTYCLDANEGSRSSGLGFGAGYRQKAGNDNLFGGFNAGRGEDAVEGVPTYYNVSRTTALGSEAMRLGIATGADDYVAVGYRAGYGVTTGSGGVLLGSGAGSDLTTADNAIVIGKDQQADSATNDNQINIGGRYFHDRIKLTERTADPAEPAEGEVVVWMSNGAGKGDDGDVLVAVKAGGTTKWTTLFDKSAGLDWAA